MDKIKQIVMIAWNWIIDKGSRLLEKFGIKKEHQGQYLVILFALIVGAKFLPGVLHYLHIDPTILLVFLVILGLTLIMVGTLTIAAIAIFRSFFVVGAGLSLIIFIADEYCKLDASIRTINKSVETLVEIGMFYVAGLFVVCLYKELFGDKEAKSETRQKGIFKVLKERNGGKHSLLILSFYAIFFGALLAQLLQVVFLIVKNLCVYTSS